MRKLIILAILSVVLCLTNGEDNNNVPKKEVKIDPEPIPFPTSTSAPTNAPPTQPTTQPPTTKTPVTKPTTPSTTTTKPTTPSTTPTTPSTTTTTTAPTPTTKPTPKPKPEAHTWVVNYAGTNQTCIVLKMILKIEVPYNKTNSTQLANTTVVVPTTAEATGDCMVNSNGTEQSLTLTWKEGNDSNSVTLSFKKKDTKYTLHSVVAQIIPDPMNFPNATNNNSIVANHTKDEFLTPVAMSYRCKQDEFLPVQMPENETGKFIVSNLQVQAFRNATGQKFDSAKDCESGETPGIVPIAVGCSLAALIIIVLVAYLVGRRRSQARGYLSIMFREHAGCDDSMFVYDLCNESNHL